MVGIIFSSSEASDFWGRLWTDFCTHPDSVSHVHMFNIHHLFESRKQNTHLFNQNQFCVSSGRHLQKNVAQDVWNTMITVELLIFLKALSLKYSRVFFDFITAAGFLWGEIRTFSWNVGKTWSQGFSSTLFSQSCIPAEGTHLWWQWRLKWKIKIDLHPGQGELLHEVDLSAEASPAGLSSGCTARSTPPVKTRESRPDCNSNQFENMQGVFFHWCFPKKYGNPRLGESTLT